MTFWKIRPVSELPHVTLELWAVFEVDDTSRHESVTRHFVGYVSEAQHGQVSSAIQVFDAASMSGITLSGRRYTLLGPPGTHPDTQYIWGVWKARNKITDELDVTEAVLREIEAARYLLLGAGKGTTRLNET